MKIKIDSVLKDFYSHFEASGFKAYLVGGAVRDIFLHKKPHDLMLPLTLLHRML